MTQHWETCETAICADDRTPEWENNVKWFPGEEVCKKVPLRLFQKKQNIINEYIEKGIFKYPDYCFTAEMLEQSKFSYKEAKGIDPDAFQDTSTNPATENQV